MNESKVISIIIPHYNSWEYLEQLLKSIGKNSLVEIIVIDDNSPTKEKLEFFHDKFPDVMFLSNEKGKKGAGSARNIGLNNASGKWIFFADSDDFFEENGISILLSYASCEKDVIYFQPTSLDVKTGQIGRRHRVYADYVKNYDGTRETELNLRYKYYVPWSKLIKKTIINYNDIRFEEIMYSNDLMFSTKVGFYSEQIAVSDKIVYCVRENSGGLTSNLTSEKLKVRFMAWVRYYNFLSANLSYSELISLNITSWPFIKQCLKNRLSISEFFFIIKESYKAKMKIFK